MWYMPQILFRVMGNIEPAMLDDMPGASSTTTFPDESPTRADFKLWNDCLRAVSSAVYVFPQPLGAKVAKGHIHRYSSVSVIYVCRDPSPRDCAKLPNPAPLRLALHWLKVGEWVKSTTITNGKLKTLLSISWCSRGLPLQTETNFSLGAHAPLIILCMYQSSCIYT